MFLSSGLGMTYEAERVEEAGSGARPMRFQNVFVNRSAYAGFAETGEWPDGSIFILEIRQAVSEASINVAGSFQSELLVLEAEVKDSRFEDGWGFYNFGAAGSMPRCGRAPCRPRTRRRASHATPSTPRWSGRSCSSIRWPWRSPARRGP